MLTKSRDGHSYRLMPSLLYGLTIHTRRILRSEHPKETSYSRDTGSQSVKVAPLIGAGGGEVRYFQERFLVSTIPVPPRSAVEESHSPEDGRTERGGATAEDRESKAVSNTASQFYSCNFSADINTTHRLRLLR